MTTPAVFTRPMSPDDVLGVLNNRELRGRKWAADWTAATTIARAIGAFDRFQAAAVSDLTDDWNEFFDTKISEEDFTAALCPTKTKTLGDLCQLIALHAKVPRIEPRTKERAQEVVLAILSSKGVDIPAVDASSRLEPFLRTHRKIFEKQIFKLGCGRVPAPTIDFPRSVGRFSMAAAALFVTSCLVGLVDGFLAAVSIIANDIGVPIFISCWSIAAACMASIMLSHGLSYALGYSKPRLEGIETFGDLAEAIVGDPIEYN